MWNLLFSENKMITEIYYYYQQILEDKFLVSSIPCFKLLLQK